MITIKVIQREPKERPDEQAELSADVVLEHNGAIVKDVTGVFIKLVKRSEARDRLSQKQMFIDQTAALCLAGMMANPARDEDDEAAGGTFLSYGIPEYGARRAATMALALWEELHLK
jgi:hypothetical protein